MKANQDFFSDPLYRSARQILLSRCTPDNLAETLDVLDETWELYSQEGLSESYLHGEEDLLEEDLEVSCSSQGAARLESWCHVLMRTFRQVGLRLRENPALIQPDRLREELLVQAKKLGADTELERVLDGFMNMASSSLAADLLASPQSSEEDFPGLVGQSAAMCQLKERVRRAASSNRTALILGETGTGKEAVARALHRHSKRNDHLFLPLNCANLPRDLIESELFGHEKGAFTGAHKARDGYFQAAESGTLFLDEIGAIDPALQAKLLRVLQDKSFIRVGGTRLLKVDVRIIAATNKDLEEAVRQGHFREDLFYRLNVIEIVVPPLRRRREDIPLLSTYFLQRAAAEEGRAAPALSPQVESLFQLHAWPGNVRELQTAIEGAVALCRDSLIEVEHLNQRLQRIYREHHLKVQVLEAMRECQWREERAARKLGLQESEVESCFREILAEALDQSARPEVTQAAQALGMGRELMHRKRNKYGLQRG